MSTHKSILLYGPALVVLVTPYNPITGVFAHVATCANTPVIGLYGVTNTTRAGPYNSIDLCVDKYNSALKKYTGKKPEEANWRYKNNHKDVMSLIGVDEVREKVDKLFLKGA